MICWAAAVIVLAAGWAPALFGQTPGRDFTIVALPDTQKYAKTNAAIFQAQADWIIANRTNLNIVYVAHLGDITDNGDEQPYQWDAATNALYRLLDPMLTGTKDGIPTGVVPGNHDHYGGTKLYNQFFGLGVFTNRSWYGGYYGADNQNHYDFFSASGMDFVVVHSDFYDKKLNYEPLNAWANAVLKSNANRRAIVVTHCILKADGAYDPKRDPSLYESLKDNANLFLMLCGHNHGEAYRAETNSSHVIHVALSNYQSRANGGDGWLRLYRFWPSNNVIAVQTYSPTLGQFERDADSEFEMPYNMQGLTK
jgi:hypothetical protein